ncbi:polyphosphate polymerase domain-containing protein [Streptococcus chenjunshii]|uniref:Polyphosphate polymerase domain-containing protein n=1 Tax=Streptococcus chenjunshii TaxID=2173853 RepID=A0A372KMX3_9STRE|nr:polyphosphate polymerase domain-containing protein [Streptococcus chenjunshii]AXQ79004.1 polyphosphate polymerase domain-containing protein [Streptococcus chenjunshii]RFU51431.1 polyphosphate polymerase domain-containing protein [Streptococcus chenjunshii]RFU53631.1 polyphosphate polymerase domain-containing protein [Streptococcus chenjunshii]
MVREFETSFKRIETKYIVAAEELSALLADLKEYLAEDDFPRSTITNIYFDNQDFQVIRDSIDRKNGREKVRMRTYVAHPTANSRVFLELKKKDKEGVGHKYRIASDLQSVLQFMENGRTTNATVDDKELIDELTSLKKRYTALSPKMYIYYERYSLKEKHSLEGYPQTKVRVTIDQNLIYRDYDVTMLEDRYGRDLVGEGKVIMEIKAPGEQPVWLQEIIKKYELEPTSFSKYGTAYRKSQGILQ